MAMCVTFALVSGARAQPTQMEVRQVLRDGAFPESFAELAASYDRSASPLLTEMLNSPTETANRGRIATLLGATGDESAVGALISFIEKPANTEHISYEEQEARVSAIRALGYLVNRTGNERALKYLIDGLTPVVWSQRGVTGMAPSEKSYEEYYRALSRQAIFALAYSGHPAAAEAITTLQQSPTAGQSQFRSSLPDGVFTQWLEVHKLVAERGLDGMYEYYEGKRQEDGQRQLDEANRVREQQEQIRSQQEAIPPGR